MSEQETPNKGQTPPPVAAEEPLLEDDIEKLVNEVESLTTEVLVSTDSNPAGSEVPTRDPAKEPIADDAGLSAASPLVQDGAPTSVEEVVADVDHELDEMEKLIGGLGESMEAEDDAADLIPSSEVESQDDPASATPDAVPGVEKADQVLANGIHQGVEILRRGRLVTSTTGVLDLSQPLKQRFLTAHRGQSPMQRIHNSPPPGSCHKNRRPRGPQDRPIRSLCAAR